MNKTDQAGDVMIKKIDMDLIVRELAQVSPLVSYVVDHSEELGGTQSFLFVATHKLTTDEMISICRDMAAVIRRKIPERPDGWAALIYAEQFAGTVMGWYRVGWAGKADEWQLREGQEWTAAYYAEFLALRDRLRAAVTMLGTEGDSVRRDGDFHVADGEYGKYTQTVFVYRPEFLTTDLIRTIQNLLRDGSDEWTVEIGGSFGSPFEALWEGIHVRVDRVVEQWDRSEAEELLGDRLKIPRYIQG